MEDMRIENKGGGNECHDCNDGFYRWYIFFNDGYNKMH